MLKKIAAAILIVTWIGGAFANVCTIIPGRITCESGEVDHVSGYGVVNLFMTNVTGLTQVRGTLSANNTKFNGLNVHGTTSLMRCSVKGDTTFKGILLANETNFESSVDLYSSKSNLERSSIKGDLNIRKTSDIPQILYLNDASQIDGDVVFESGHGQIILSDDSKVTGKIIGGNIVQKN